MEKRNSSVQDNTFEGLNIKSDVQPHVFVSMSEEYPQSCGICGKHADTHDSVPEQSFVHTSAIFTRAPARRVTIEEIHEYAKDKGWWEPPSGDNTQEFISIPYAHYQHLLVASKLMLMVSEISEALEELRDHGLDPAKTFRIENGKPEGLFVELADNDIRHNDLLGYLGLTDEDYQKIKAIKHDYNLTRQHRHGGRKL